MEVYKTLVCQKSLLSPIRRLPVELLTEVFKLVGTGPISFKTDLLEVDFEKEDAQKQRWARERLFGSGFTLTWVCYRWRQHALALPELWSSFSFGSIGQEDSPVAIAFLKECIRRSGNRTPLDICIDLDSIRCPAWHDSAQLGVIAVLAEHAEGLRNFECCVDRIGALDGLYHILVLQESVKRSITRNTRNTPFTFLPHLESLTLVFDFDVKNLRDPSLTSPALKIFSALPRLHTLEMTCLRATDAIDVSSLKMLKTQYYVGDTVAYLLERCPNLESLTVQSVLNSPFPDPPTSSPTFSHVNLINLRVTAIDEDFASNAWKSLRLPKLEHLLVAVNASRANRYFFPNANREDPISDLKKMLLRSECTLSTVTFLRINILLAVANWFFDGLKRNPDSKESDFMIEEGFIKW
ncbi:hypothetical protein D9757_013537 [Collybiopsis confluens]|uniref:F-box domain-containing protein n=1 Tax=Collybiopsis confluens TaxID=2823264 RepID=A0A8H5CZF9_9AGAR|nr:hypothetical protein D9757_013537 [Collybiopsis confluens]